MKSEQQNIGEYYSSLATNETDQQVTSVTAPKIREKREMVYGGSPAISNYHTSDTKVSQLINNKKKSKKKLSPFTIILILIVFAVASIIYIGNILTVGKLLEQNNRLQIKHKENLSEQELLRAQINRLSSLERIQLIATEQLKLKKTKSIPQWIEVEPKRIDEIENFLQQKTAKLK